MALNGLSERQIDAKGRLSLPKKMRRLLLGTDSADIIVLKMDDCLQIYPAESWEHIQSKITGLSPFNAKTRILQRLWGMSSDTMSLDSEGRISLTSEQKEFAGIKEQVVVIGAINKIEIWSKKRWDTVVPIMPTLENLSNEVADLS